MPACMRSAFRAGGAVSRRMGRPEWTTYDSPDVVEDNLAFARVNEEELLLGVGRMGRPSYLEVGGTHDVW